MKIRLINNAELVIGAREGDEKDYQQALKIAEKMVEMGDVDCVIASAEDGEFIHVTACWNHYQASELREAYKAAKAA